MPLSPSTPSPFSAFRSNLPYSTAFGVLMAGIVIATPSRAQVNIPITNASFESPVQTANNYTSNGIQGWTNGGSSQVGVFFPSSSSYFSTAPPDGTQIGFTNGGSIAQQLSSTLQVGTYNLSAFGGIRNDGFSGNFGLELWAGGTVSNGVVVGGTELSSALFNVNGLSSGFFYSVSTSYTEAAGNPLLGSALSVEILNTAGPQADFDAVKLTLTSAVGAPEPGVLAMMLAAGLPFAGALKVVTRKRS